jgi:hypothetical protein
MLLWAQGLYYLATGVWPLVSIETFQRVTGRKTDHLVTGDPHGRRPGDYLFIAGWLSVWATERDRADWSNDYPFRRSLMLVQPNLTLTVVSCIHSLGGTAIAVVC